MQENYSKLHYTPDRKPTWGLSGIHQAKWGPLTPPLPHLGPTFGAYHYINVESFHMSVYCTTTFALVLKTYENEYVNEMWKMLR